MAVNVTYYLGLLGANSSDTVYQNSGQFGKLSEDPKYFSTKEAATLIMETLPNGRYYLAERYIKS
jgi:hypothetical protein